jgi:peroxiredoxin
MAKETDMVAVGDKIPDVEARVLGDNGMPVTVSTGEYLGSGKVVLFAVPGAFTPGCSKQHLPGFVKGAEALAGKGVDKIVCTGVNDAWTMDAWAESQGAKGKIEMLSDGNATFAQAMGQSLDGSGFGLGTRSKRYAAVIEDGIITKLEHEPDGTGVDVSSCENVLAKL